MPRAARVGDDHQCRKQKPVAHRGGEIMSPGCETVTIGGSPAARVGDTAWCEGGSRDLIVSGEATVEIAGKPAARLGDYTAGGWIRTGSATVFIGGARPKRRRRRRAR